MKCFSRTDQTGVARPDRPSTGLFENEAAREANRTRSGVSEYELGMELKLLHPGPVSNFIGAVGMRVIVRRRHRAGFVSSVLMNPEVT